MLSRSSKDAIEAFQSFPARGRLFGRAKHRLRYSRLDAGNVDTHQLIPSRLLNVRLLCFVFVEMVSHVRYIIPGSSATHLICLQAAQATFKSIKSVIPLLDRVLVQRFKPETVSLIIASIQTSLILIHC